jgi:hypothetical protein
MSKITQTDLRILIKNYQQEATSLTTTNCRPNDFAALSNNVKGAIASAKVCYYQALLDNAMLYSPVRENPNLNFRKAILEWLSDTKQDLEVVEG